MKKILIVSHALEIGGAERSLIGLLDAIDKKEYQVDLFLLRHEGELFSFIPEGIHLLSEIPSYTVLARPMVQTLKEGHVVLTAARMYGKIKASKYIKDMDIQTAGYHLSTVINIHIVLCQTSNQMRNMIWQSAS